MNIWSRSLAALVLLVLNTHVQAVTALGEINIELYGNIVDFTL